VEVLLQVHSRAGFGEAHDGLPSNHDEVGKRNCVTEVLVDVMQGLIERVWICVAIHVEITLQAIDQAFVVRVVEPEATVRTTQPTPKVHEIMASSTENTTSEVRKLAVVVRARRARLVLLHDCVDLADDLVVLSTRHTKCLARGSTVRARHDLLQAKMQQGGCVCRVVSGAVRRIIGWAVGWIVGGAVRRIIGWAVRRVIGWTVRRRVGWAARGVVRWRIRRCCRWFDADGAIHVSMADPAGETDDGAVEATDFVAIVMLLEEETGTSCSVVTLCLAVCYSASTSHWCTVLRVVVTPTFAAAVSERNLRESDAINPVHSIVARVCRRMRQGLRRSVGWCVRG